MQSIGRGFAWIFLLAFAGCQPASHGVTITTGDEKTLDALITAHKGKVVFVDYWATWCGPCVEFFPHTVELNKKYQGQGLATIAVSFDEPGDEKVVREFLMQQGGSFENLLSRYGVGTEAFEKFQIDQVPHFRLYDRNGTVRHKWDDKPEDIEQKVQELLAEKA